MLTGRRFVGSILPPILKRCHYLHLLSAAETPPDLLRCREYIREGDCVLDLGANIGTYSKVLSEWAGPTGRVHAFEPIRETFGYLTAGIRKLGLRNVTCHNAAVSWHTGEGRMMIPDANMYKAEISDRGSSVRLVRLDDLFAERISFIKCDVEGHELQVIQGSEKLLRTWHPTWLMEVSRPDVTEVMRSYGYRATRLEHDWLFVPD